MRRDDGLVHGQPPGHLRTGCWPDRREVVAAGIAGVGTMLVGCSHGPAVVPSRGQQTAIVPMTQPLIIAHRGASGERPEHTLSAYALAIAQGADVIEPDLVLTRDGVLVCRHENEISETTDIADRPRFADRKARKQVDGVWVEGWFTEDFTLDELKTLRCRERLPLVRPANRDHDGKEPIPTFAEMIAMVQAESRARGRSIGVYPETKHPSYFEALGLDFTAPLLADLDAAGWNSRQAPVYVQSFEVGNLRVLSRKSAVRLIQLMAAEGAPWDHRNGAGWDYRLMASYRWMGGARDYLFGIGPQKQMIWPWESGRLANAPSGLVQAAHDQGLAVHAWTVRAENMFLPLDLRSDAADGGKGSPSAFGDMEAEVSRLLDAGVDGLFTDHPGRAVTARTSWLAAGRVA